MINAVRLVTKEYWIIGMPKKRLTAKWVTISRGAIMIKVSLEKVILGSPLNYLY